MTLTSAPAETLALQRLLLNFSAPVYAFRAGGQVIYGATPQSGDLIAYVPPALPENLGDVGFRAAHGLRYAYSAGAMAGGIASEALVIALGQGGFLGSFGAAGLVPARIEAAIQAIQAALPNGPYAFNLIHSPSEEALEQRAVDLYLAHGVRTVEASAFLDLTPHIVRYRAAGLRSAPDGSVLIGHKVIAKLSRREVAAKFMSPASERLLRELVTAGAITAEQAALAARVPVADDVTAEADSGGHTDNRPLVTLLPSILSMRDETQAKHQFATPVRVGAGGGIGTPGAALAALAMGAGYLVTGSINQAALESGTSAYTRKILAQADMADVMMAPSADMFEMGVKVQLLKRGTQFPMRAQKLYELYRAYDSWEAVPASERENLETKVFKRTFDAIWADTVKFFTERDPEQIARAEGSSKRKMALVFRWYLGLSSRWASSGEKGREMDYQIWCGPSMGAFNDWARGTYLEAPENRHAVDIALHMLRGAAYLWRVNALKVQGVAVPAVLERYTPAPLG